MSIRFDESRKLFFLETEHNTYQMKIAEVGVLLHCYYGYKIGDTDMSYQHHFVDRGFSGNPYEVRLDRGFSLDTVPQEYSSTGVGDFRISSFEAINKNGSTSFEFRYVSHEIRKGKYEIPGLPSVRDNGAKVDTLIISLKDSIAQITVKLYFGVYEERDIITRTVEVINDSTEPIFLEKVASMCMDFYVGKMDMMHFYGKHCMERKPDRFHLTQSIHTVGSKRGMSSHHHNPFVILCDPDATEYQGDCWGFMLMYSGNHKFEVEVDQAGSTRIVAGIHNENFHWHLEPKRHFYAPEMILSYSERGFNMLSQHYHRIIRENVCPPRFLHERRPVLINNWEATYFDFNADKIIDLIHSAHDLGIEMFVLDDGWFGARNSDRAGLGDWYVNEEKLEGGLKRIANEANSLGMRFGLWVEPEMINQDSDLYRAHPDWALNDPNRPPMVSRAQLVLDMSRPDVMEYLFERLCDILDNANIEYLKWDFNRSVANLYSHLLPSEKQGEVAHRFILGTYELLDRLTKRYPNLLIEGCAGGGGRFDAAMLYYSPQIWCSDDTDPICRLEIQKGTSYGYPISCIGSHVSASPNHQTGRSTPLKTRGVVAMAGTFGYELDLGKLSDAEKEEVKLQIEIFKKYYWLIQEGYYYRLEMRGVENYYTAWEHVAKDKSEALVCLVMTDPQANPEFPYVKIYGLDEDAMYNLEGTDQYFTGAALMFGGYVFEPMYGDYPTEQLHFVKVVENE